MTIEPTLDGVDSAISMALFGFGIGIMAAVLGNLVRSPVCERDRSEAGDLRGTSTQLGTALGTAVIGAIVISGLESSFATEVAADERVPAEVAEAVEVSHASGVSFVASSDGRVIVDPSDADPALIDALIDGYEEAQLQTRRTALSASAGIVLVSLLVSGQLPTRRADEIAADGAGASASETEPSASDPAHD